MASGRSADDNNSFDSPREEANYYRDKYRVAIDLLNETRNELGKFVIVGFAGGERKNARATPVPQLPQNRTPD